MFVTKDGKLEHTYYCDYNDKISSKTMEKIIENYKDTAATIQDAVLLYAYDDNWFDYYNSQHHKSVMSFIEKTGLEYSDYIAAERRRLPISIGGWIRENRGLN